MKTLKLCPTVLAVLEPEVIEIVDPRQRYELPEDMMAPLRVTAQAIEGERLRVTPDNAQTIHDVLTDLANTYDYALEYGEGCEDRVFARRARDSLTTLATRVRRVTAPV